MSRPMSGLLAVLDRWDYRAKHQSRDAASATRECAAELRSWISDGLCDVFEAVRADEAVVGAPAPREEGK